MPSLGASPLQNPDPIVHKVSNGHTVHFCESAAEENKNYLKKYLPVSRAVLHLLNSEHLQVVCGVNTHSAVTHQLFHFSKSLTDSSGRKHLFYSSPLLGCLKYYFERKPLSFQ